MPADAQPETFRCSDAARARQDPMLGTAPPQARFLLVEQEAGWAPDGFASAPLPEDVRAEVQQRAAALGARILLIRRPGRHASSVCSMRAWCAVDVNAPAGHRVTWGTWAYPTELLAGLERLEELARADGPGGTAGATPTGTPGPGADEQVLLVCTHGRKDVCCAVRGRPVAQALAGRWPEQTWECSHTGGDRFAANLLMLPDGATYGGLDVADAEAVVADHQAGRPRTEALRGVVGHPRAVQAAIVAVHERLGPVPWGSPRPTGVEETAPSETAPSGTASDQVRASRVGLRLGDGRGVEVEVSEHLREPAQLTCRAAGAKVSQVPVVTGLRILGPA